jgi:hypothetical protein
MLMKTYRYIKITDNNDHRHFWIDFTSMNDYRIRVAILWSKYLNYLEGKGEYRPVYSVLHQDWSAYCIERSSFSNLNEVRCRLHELNAFYKNKLIGYEPERFSPIISFK